MSERPRQGKESPRRARKSVTIKDVARESAVSIATVTRVLQDSSHVTPETRSRVQAAISRLGYRPDSHARALVTRTSQSFGLIIPTSADPYWGAVATGMEERARQSGYLVLLGHGARSDTQERDLAELFLSQRVEGLVLGGPTSYDQEWLAATASEVPVVLIGSDVPTAASRAMTDGTPHSPERVTEEAIELGLASLKGVPQLENLGLALVSDDATGVKAVMEHLVGLGHRRFGLIGGELLRPALAIVREFRHQLAELGLDPCPVWRCQETLEGGRSAGQAMLSGEDAPTAIVAYNDVLALGAMRAARELGLRIPDDVSVVGFDDIEAAAFAMPPLTSVRLPKFEFGSLAVEALLEAGDSGRLRVGRRELPVELVVRGTTASPPVQR